MTITLHDHAITAILPHLKSAAARLLSRAAWVRERSLATLAPPDNDRGGDPDSGGGAAFAVSDNDDGADSPLRPNPYCLDHDVRVVIPIEFTVADAANLGTAVGRKHAKYDPWLLCVIRAPRLRALSPVHVTPVFLGTGDRSSSHV